MNISVKSKSKFRRAYVPTTALAKAMEFEDDIMHVFLTDGHIVSVPIIWFPLEISAAALGGAGQEECRLRFLIFKR
jgi:hypothetical protein